jgi:hypothetical protein
VKRLRCVLSKVILIANKRVKKMKHIVKVHTGKRLSDSFPIQNGLKQGDALTPLLFDFAIRKV